MNIIITDSQFDINNIIFLEPKQNIIIEGVFTKFIYSNGFISINGIFVCFDIIPMLDISSNIFSPVNISNQHRFKPISDNDMNIAPVIYVCTQSSNLQRINCKNDTDLNSSQFSRPVSYSQKYKINNQSNKFSIKNQEYIIQTEQRLLDYYKAFFNCKKQSIYILKNQIQNDDKCYNNFYKSSDKLNDTKCLKISGIWETDTEIGITYKIINGKSI